MVGRSEDACRQAASRARRRVRDERRWSAPTNGAVLLEAFLDACRLGDVDGLRSLLAADATLVSDGGALVHAARRPVVGADRITRLLINLAKKLPPELRIEPLEINGEPGFVGHLGGVAVLAVALEASVDTGDEIAAVRIMVNPDKLRALPG